MRCGADKAQILMVVARSSPWGTAWKNSLRSSREGGITTSFYGLLDDLGINSDSMPIHPQWTEAPPRDYHPEPPQGWHKII
jgi:hypothetical protein